jgi:hypothetical protein
MKTDIAELRRAFPGDEHFAAALRSISSGLRSLQKAGGTELDRELTGWIRVKLSSTVVDRADLRIIYRAVPKGFELRAFGHRHDPDSVYFRAAKR